MGFVFELLGVSPILDVFQHQTFRQHPQGLAYLSAPEARLDPFLESARQVSPDRGWNVDQAVDSVIRYWLRNAEAVHHWQLRLLESGRECLLVARLGDEQAYRNDLNALLTE